MSGRARVLADGAPSSRLDRALYRLERAFALLGGLAIFSLMFLAVFSVSGRNFFNAPLPGYVDWIEQAMPLIAFMGISYTQRDGGHIRMDILILRLRGRTLWAAELATSLAILALVGLMIWGSWTHFERSFDWNAPMWSRDSSMDIALPIWPAKLLAPVAFSVLFARLLLHVWIYARALWRGEPEPAGVPLVESAATTATRDALRSLGERT